MISLLFGSMRNPLLKVLWTEFVLCVLLYLMLFPKMGSFYDTIWIFFSAIFLTYIPGNRLTYCFFPGETLSRFERFMMSFLLSITALILFSYYMYYSGVTLTQMKLYIAVFVLLIVTMFFALLRNKLTKVDDVDYDDIDYNKEISE